MSSVEGARSHVFAGNPLRRHHSEPSSPVSALKSLTDLLLGKPHERDGRPSPDHKVLPFRKGRPLAFSSDPVSPDSSPPKWRLGWLAPSHFRDFSVDSLVHLGSDPPEDGGVVYWAVDVTGVVGFGFGAGDGSNFVELRTLMVATRWGYERAMGELAVAGHCLSLKNHTEEIPKLQTLISDEDLTSSYDVTESQLNPDPAGITDRWRLQPRIWPDQAKALLEWHNTSRFCGYCGSVTLPIDAGRRKQCTNDSCKKKIYPRVDPVVIMLVIDKTNDRVLLCRPSRFIPRMWSCLSGFTEPGESLEEAVKRETWEETGVEVGEVVYHSSQPWPVGLSSMPCQLMVGLFAYAKSLDIRVDKKELDDAQWHSREDVKKALTFAEYEKAQRTAADKVNQMCKGVERDQSLLSDFSVESGELAPMFVPGPFAIAHHLISSWVNQGAP